MDAFAKLLCTTNIADGDWQSDPARWEAANAHAAAEVTRQMPEYMQRVAHLGHQRSRSISLSSMAISEARRIRREWLAAN